MWRSLVAHTLGVRVVAGSNPAAPTNQFLCNLLLFYRSPPFHPKQRTASI